MWKSAFLKYSLKLFLLCGLLACSGALEVPGPGGSLGVAGPVGSSGNISDPAQAGSSGLNGTPIGLSANSADGTLSSQSGYQELENGCHSEFSLRLSGEPLKVDNETGWVVPGEDPAFFPKAKVVRGEWDSNILTPCLDCQGRLLRVIDLGEMPDDSYTLQKHSLRLGLWGMALTRDNWNSQLVPAATYRDFIVNSSGEVNLGAQEMVPNHLYYFLISKQAGAPVTEPTAFASVQEFNSMSSCSKKPEESAALEYVRLIHALASAPSDFKPVHLYPEVQSSPIIFKQNLEILQDFQ